MVTRWERAASACILFACIVLGRGNGIVGGLGVRFGREGHCPVYDGEFAFLCCLNTRGEFSGVLGRWRIREGRVGEKHNGWNQAADEAGQQKLTPIHDVD